MITISILGLDQFVVGRYSKENTNNLANLCEVSSDKIVFYAPNSMIFHNGVEQTSWNTVVIVRAPLKIKVLEKQIAEYIMKTITTYTINVSVDFQYYEQDSHYEKINSSYERFISSTTQPEAYVEEEDECDCGCEDHDHEHDHEHEDSEEEIYLGNAFEGFEEKLAAKEKKDN